jgi:hypothetical protein
MADGRGRNRQFLGGGRKAACPRRRFEGLKSAQGGKSDHGNPKDKVALPILQKSSFFERFLSE